jgi:hypothetical protein
MKVISVVIIVATTGVSAFLHSEHHLRILNAAMVTKRPMLGEVVPNASTRKMRASLPRTAPPRTTTTTTTTTTATTSRSTTVQLFMTPLNGIAYLYSYATSNYYLATQAATMSLFSGAGDFLAQTLERRSHSRRMMKLNSNSKINMIPHDWKRTRRFLMKGIGCGLIWTAWYQIAELWSHGLTNAVMMSYQATMSKQSLNRLEAVVYTLLSIALEQFVGSPIIFALWDIPLLSYLHGTPVAKLPGEVRKKLLPLLIANAKLWTLVNILIYNVPLQFRVAALSCADLVWQTILSTQLASPSATDDDDQTCIDAGDEESALPLVA